MAPYRVAMFDLDGTLAASKSDVSPATVRMLCALLLAIDVSIISGGRFEQFDAQVLRHLGRLATYSVRSANSPLFVAKAAAQDADESINAGEA